MIIRTIKGAAAYLRDIDPQTPITENVIRAAILRGDLAAIKSGNKYLVNIEVLEEYLKGQLQK